MSILRLPRSKTCDEGGKDESVSDKISINWVHCSADVRDENLLSGR